MSAELAPAEQTTAATLRALEQSAPKSTPAPIRQALIAAATELERRERAACDSIRVLEEALALRVSQMDSQSRTGEIDRQVKGAMRSAVTYLRG